MFQPGSFKKMISSVLSDFSSEYYFKFLPLFFQANKTKVTWKANLHVQCSTDQNSLDINFFQEAS